MVRVTVGTERLVSDLGAELELSANRMVECRKMGLAESCESLSYNIALVERFLETYSPKIPQAMFGNFGQWRLISELKHELRVSGAVANGFSPIEVRAMMNLIRDIELKSEIDVTKIFLIGFWIPIHLFIYFTAYLAVWLKKTHNKNNKKATI